MRCLHLTLPALLAGSLSAQVTKPASPTFEVRFPVSRSTAPLDGRLLFLVSTDSTAEPRFQISDAANTQLVFGMDVDGWAPGKEATVDAAALRRTRSRSLADLPPGRYWVQALLNRYETFRRSDGHVVKLPPDRGEGQQWNRKPGNLYSTPRWMQLDDPAAGPERPRARPGDRRRSPTRRTRSTSGTSPS